MSTQFLTPLTKVKMRPVINIMVYFSLFLLFFPFTTYATTQTLILTDSATTQSASAYLHTLEDAKHALTLKHIISPAHSQQFAPNTQSTPNFGRTRSVYWLRFNVKNQSSVKWYLLMDALLGEDLDLYIVPKEETSTINHPPLAQRINDHRRAVWSLNLPQNKAFTVYIRASNGGKTLKLPIEFITADTLLKHTIDDYRLFTFLHAAMLILALYNLFLFFSFREVSYLSLVGVILSTAAAIHIGNPVFDSLRFLSRTDSYFYTLPMLMVIISYSFFSRQILQTEKEFPKLDKIYRYYIGIAILLIPIAGLMPSAIIIPLAMSISLLCLTFIFGAFIVVTQRNSMAKHLSLATLAAVMGAIPELASTLFNTSFWITPHKGMTLMGIVASLVLLSFLQTERTRLLRQKMEQTKAISEAKDSFFAVMSHELRTPMNTVLGVSTLLKLSTLNAKQQGYLEKLELSARHLLGLISDILDTAKIKNKHFQLTIEPFQLNTVANKVHHLLEEQATQKGLTLIIDMTTDESIDQRLLGDAKRLSQILINLLSNAIKFTEHGNITLTIQTVEAAQPQTFRFTISDTGIGIPKAQQAALFDPFTQVEQSTARFNKGTGLGLTISKGLVEIMGGKLELESAPNEGSRFFFTLNFALDKGSNPVDTQQTSPNANALSTLVLPKKINILLVDDNEMNRFIGREMIQAMQGKVTLAPDGESAIVQLQQHHFNVVLMDISMPNMDGFEVTRWIRTQGQNPNITIIALTAHATDTIRQQCAEAGMDGYLSKPFEYEDLHTAILKSS